MNELAAERAKGEQAKSAVLQSSGKSAGLLDYRLPKSAARTFSISGLRWSKYVFLKKHVLTIVKAMLDLLVHA